MAIAHAWSQHRVLCVASETGSSEMHDRKCLSSFEDDVGNIVTREISRPKILFVLFEFLSLADEHNNQRQSMPSA